MAKYCPKCGKEHIDNEDYCVDCGTELPNEREKLSTVNGNLFNEEKDIVPQSKYSPEEIEVKPIPTTILSDDKQEEIKEKPKVETRKQNVSIFSKENEEKNTIFKEDEEKDSFLDKLTSKLSNSPDDNENKTFNKITIGLIAIIVIAIVAIAGFSMIGSENTSNTTTYNNTVFSLSIPDNYTQVNPTGVNAFASFEGVNPNTTGNITFYNRSTISNEIDGLSIKAISDIHKDAINYDGGIISNSSTIKIDGHDAYCINYTYDNQERVYIGFVNGTTEYSILFSNIYNGNNTSFNTTVSEIIDSIKFK